MFTPKTATEAALLIRRTENAAKMNALIFWNGDGTATLDSMKVNEEGKKVRSRYEIDLNKKTCSCPDFAGNRMVCKHLIYADGIAADMEIEEGQESLLAQMDEDAETAEVYPY